MKVLLVLLGMLFLTACAHQPEPVARPDDSSETTGALELQNSSLQKSLDEHEKQQRALKDDIYNLQLQLLEKEALVNELQRHNLEQQKHFDDAIVEVVRAKAKLRSMESKADAASTIAETEIALKALKNRTPASQEGSAEISKAEKMLEMSSTEFRQQNFGGALYLARQAKSQIRMGHLALSGDKNIDILAGETLFVQPLPLSVIKNSNLRSGPDIKEKILVQLKEGTPVVGYSYKGNWVRIETKDGKSGWIFQTLVSAP